MVILVLLVATMAMVLWLFVQTRGMRLLDNDDLHVFYSDYTLDQILRLREVLHDDDSDEAVYLKGEMCGILHGPSSMYLSVQTKDTYSGTADYVREYANNNGLVCPERDIRPKAIRKYELASKDGIPSGITDRTRSPRVTLGTLLRSMQPNLSTSS